jgi:superfamily II DNA/RNA helicase
LALFLVKETFLVSFQQFNLDARLLAGVKDAGFDTPTPIPWMNAL